MIGISVVLLVDPRGWVLLQERDEHAPIAPDKWGMVGGHVEDGEVFEAAAYRELEEETGIRLEPGELRLWRDAEHESTPGEEPRHYTVWVAGTKITDADIVVGEGRQIVFVHPGDIGALDLSRSSAYYVPMFLASDEYKRLAE
jgi:8-oxo-dGTP diphosphatase